MLFPQEDFRKTSKPKQPSSVEFCLLKHNQLLEEPLKIKHASIFSQVLCLLKDLTVLLVCLSSIKPIPQPIQKHMVNTKMGCGLHSLSLNYDRHG